jgi:hypothetical protein
LEVGGDTLVQLAFQSPVRKEMAPLLPLDILQQKIAPQRGMKVGGTAGERRSLVRSGKAWM